MGRSDAEWAEWAREKRVAFEVAPLVEMREGEKLQVGFTLTLYAAVPMELPAGAAFAQPLASERNAFLYVFEGSVNVGPAGAARTPLSGSPPQIVEDLLAYAASGVQHFVLDFSVPTVPQMLEVLERFAAEVRPELA